MKKIKTLTLIAFVLLLLAAVPSALAYIFTYTEVKLDKDVSLYYSEPYFDEKWIEGRKDLTITAAEDSDYMFVRVIALTDDEERQQFLIPPSSQPKAADESEVWEYRSDGYFYRQSDGKRSDWYYDPADGYWYYLKPIRDQENTSTLTIYYGEEPDDDDGEEGDDFHVIVLYEAVPASYSDAEVAGAKVSWYDETNNGYWYAMWTETFIVPEDGD